MAALQVSGIHVPRSPRVQSGSCSCSYGDRAPPRSNFVRVAVLRPFRRQQQYGCLLVCSRARSRARFFQFVSFQDVAENESDSNDAASPSSSAPTLDRDRVWQQLQGSWQVWSQNLSDRGSLQIAKQFLTITETRIKNKDAKQSLAKKLDRLKTPDVARLWSRIDPSVKWPVVTFFSFYLVVTASCGAAVSRELWPLWTIWPLAMSFYIQAGRFMVEEFRKRVVPVVLPKLVKLASDLRSGKLKKSVENRLLELRTKLSETRAAAIVYLKTQALSDAKALLLKLAIWMMEKLEDFIDWVWPSWRIFRNWLYNLF